MRDRLEGPVYGSVFYCAAGDIHAKDTGLFPPIAPSLRINWTPSNEIVSNVNRRFIHPLTTLLMAAALIVLLAACGGGAGTVVIANVGNYHPFGFVNADGEIDGLERDLGDELCRRAGLECEWVVMSGTR